MDMSILNGIMNFIELISENWTWILVAVGLLIALFQKVKAYCKMTDEERIQAIKTLIRETILTRVTNAEIEYQEWISAGEIKRAQVINEIYEAYPILYKVADQDKLIQWLDDVIDEALKILREIISRQFEDTTKSDDE